LALPSRPHQVRFGEFQLDLETGELQSNRHRLILQDQPFQVLTILLQHPGRLVTREELKKTLWPTDTFVDFDHGLNKAVNRLRETLNDSADHPRFIETLPRKGYRFIVPVSSHLPLEPAAYTRYPPRAQRKRNASFSERRLPPFSPFPSQPLFVPKDRNRRQRRPPKSSRSPAWLESKMTLPSLQMAIRSLLRERMIEERV